MALPAKPSYLMGGTFNSAAPILVDGDTSPFQLDVNANLKVNVVAGTITATNPSVGLTGAVAPTSATEIGIVDSTGKLQNVTGLVLTNAKAAVVAIVDGNGNQITSFGGGTQYADDAASGATPTGTLAMGWDNLNSKIRALRVDAQENLLVNVANSSIAVTQYASGIPWSVIGSILSGSGAATDALLIVGGVTNDATSKNQPLPLGTGGRSVIIEGFSGGTAVPISGAISFTAPQHVIVDSGSITATVSGTVAISNPDVQYADDAASGATPTGILSMGWDSVNSKIRALKVDLTQNLLVLAAQGSGGPATSFWAVRVTTDGTTFAGSLSNPIFDKISDGTNAIVVKGNSAAALVTDNSLVVALSPNSPLPAGTNVIGHVIVDSGSLTVAIGAGSDTIGKVDILGNAGAILDAAGDNVAAPANEIIVGGIFNSNTGTSGAVTAGNVARLQLDNHGLMLVDLASINATAVATAKPGVIKIAPVSASDGTTLFESTIGVLDTNLKNVGNVAVVTTAGGIQTVGIKGAGHNVFFDQAIGSAVPGGALYIGGDQSGNLAPFLLDANGNLETLVNGITDGTHGPVAVKSASTAALATDPALVVTTISSTTANAPAQTAVGVSSVAILSANTARREAIVVNTGTTIIYLGLGQTPTVTAYHVALSPCSSANDGTGGTFTTDIFAGAINAIGSAASGTVCVTELT